MSQYHSSFGNVFTKAVQDVQNKQMRKLFILVLGGRFWARSLAEIYMISQTTQDTIHQISSHFILVFISLDAQRPRVGLVGLNKIVFVCKFLYSRIGA